MGFICCFMQSFFCCGLRRLILITAEAWPAQKRSLELVLSSAEWICVLFNSSKLHTARLYVCGPPIPPTDSCSLAQVYVTPQRQRIGGAGCVSLIWLLNTESGCYCNYIIFPPLCDLAASFFPRSLKHPSHTQSHSVTLLCSTTLLPLQTLKKHYSVP